MRSATAAASGGHKKNVVSTGGGGGSGADVPWYARLDKKPAAPKTLVVLATVAPAAYPVAVSAGDRSKDAGSCEPDAAKDRHLVMTTHSPADSMSSSANSPSESIRSPSTPRSAS